MNTAVGFDIRNISLIMKVRNRLLNGKSLTGEHRKGNIRMKYRYFEPGRRNNCPLIVILHGSDGRGSDNIKQMAYDTIGYVNDLRKKYSPLILLPQCPSDNVWTIIPKAPFNNFNIDSIPVSTTLEIVREIILKMVHEYSVDTDRIYITGSSMGGTGTWEIILRNPKLFAAAIPICAASDPSNAALVKDINIWAFSGEYDQYYDYHETEETVKKLKELNGNIKYTLYRNKGHEIGKYVFNDPMVSEWLFSQRKLKIA
jgi:predicted peptidase